jgi:hypothetical protein
MALYPKKLNGLVALEREKARVRKSLAAMQAESAASVEGLLAGKLPGLGGGEGNESASGFDMGSIVSGAMEYFGDGGGLADRLSGFLKGKVGRMTTRLAKEVLGGYLKWKAVTLSYKLIRKWMKTRGGK